MALLLPVAKFSDCATELLCRGCSQHVLRGTALVASEAFQLLLVGVLVSALCEEVMFREIVLQRLRNVTSEALAVGLSALSFALCHLTILAAIQALLLGLCLGAVRVATGAIVFSVLLHAGFNLALAIVALCFPMSVASSVPERAGRSAVELGRAVAGLGGRSARGARVAYPSRSLAIDAAVTRAAPD